jgi:UDP-N-acetylglucosamine:LPS N-acetylglucosamine transferase
VHSVLTSNERRERLRANAGALRHPDAAVRVAERIGELLDARALRG